MALFTIGGIAVQTPTDFSSTINDISKANRNSQGNIIIERIATKQTLTMGYAYLDQTQLKNILQAISPITFTVTYPDPTTATTRAPTLFYCGDRSMGMVDFLAGVPRYKDLKFTLIEV